MISVDTADGAVVKIAKQEASLLIKDKVIGACIAFENYVRCVVLGCWICCWGWCDWRSRSWRGSGLCSGWCHWDSARRDGWRRTGTGYESNKAEEQKHGAVDTGMMLEHGVSFQVMYGV